MQRGSVGGGFAFLGALCLVSYLLAISDSDDREWLAWRRAFTSEELQAVWERRHSSALILLVVVGKVYDVSAGRDHYVNAEYEGFAGVGAGQCAASRAT